MMAMIAAPTESTLADTTNLRRMRWSCTRPRATQAARRVSKSLSSATARHRVSGGPGWKLGERFGADHVNSPCSLVTEAKRWPGSDESDLSMAPLTDS